MWSSTHSEFRTVFFKICVLILFFLYSLLRRGLGGSECAINRQLNGPLLKQQLWLPWAGWGSGAGLSFRKLVNSCLSLSSLEVELCSRRSVPSSHWLVRLWISWAYLILIYIPRPLHEVLDVAPAFHSCCFETFLLCAIASAWGKIPPEKCESVVKDSGWEKQNKVIGDSTDSHSLNSQFSLAGLLFLWGHGDDWWQVR